MTRNGFSVDDQRALPTNEDAVRWLSTVRNAIEREFPADPPRALSEMSAVAVNWSAALRDNVVSV